MAEVTITVPDPIADAIDGCELGAGGYGSTVDLLRAAIRETGSEVYEIADAGVPANDAREASEFCDLAARLVRLSAAYTQLATERAERAEGAI